MSQKKLDESPEPRPRMYCICCGAHGKDSVIAIQHHYPESKDALISYKCLGCDTEFWSDAHIGPYLAFLRKVAGFIKEEITT